MTNICRSPLKKEGGNRLQERWSRNTKVEFTSSKKGFSRNTKIFLSISSQCAVCVYVYTRPAVLLPPPGPNIGGNRGSGGRRSVRSELLLLARNRRREGERDSGRPRIE